MVCMALPSNVDYAFFEQHKFSRIRFVYQCKIPDQQREETLSLCKEVAKVIQEKLPPGWWVMAYGALVNGEGVDVIVVNKLNSASPNLIHSVVLNK